MPSWPIPYAHEREQQAARCARFVEQRLDGRDMHVVLAGDFDVAMDSSSIRFWTPVAGRLQRGLSGCREGGTPPTTPARIFSPRKPLVHAPEMSLELGRRIDYIRVRCGSSGPTLQVADCFLVFDEPAGGVWATDRFGLVAADLPGTGQTTRLLVTTPAPQPSARSVAGVLRRADCS